MKEKKKKNSNQFESKDKKGSLPWQFGINPFLFKRGIKELIRKTSNMPRLS